MTTWLARLPKEYCTGFSQDGLTSLINPVQKGLTSVNRREPVSPLVASRTWRGHLRNYKGRDQVRVPVSFYCLDLGLFLDTLNTRQPTKIQRQASGSEDTTPRVTHTSTY